MSRWPYLLVLALLLGVALAGAFGRQWWRETRAPAWRDMAFSRDGHLLALAGSYGNVNVWDVERGVLAHRLRIGRPVSSLAFSPDGRTLAVGTAAVSRYLNQDQRVQVWDAALGRLVFTMQGTVDDVLSLAFDEAGAHLVAGSLDDTATAWNVLEGHTTATFAGPRPYEDGIERVAFTPDGAWVAGGRNDDVVLWEAGHGHPVRVLAGGGDHGLVFLDDVRLLAFDGQEVRVWNAVTGLMQARRRMTQSGRLAVAPWADLAVLADDGGTVDLLRARDLQVESSWPLQPSRACPAVAPDGDYVATREANRVHLWAVERDRIGHRQLSLRWTATVSERTEPAGWLGLQFGGEGRWLAVGEAQRVLVFEVSSGSVRLTAGRALDVRGRTP